MKEKYEISFKKTVNELDEIKKKYKEEKEKDKFIQLDLKYNNDELVKYISELEKKLKDKKTSKKSILKIKRMALEKILSMIDESTSDSYSETETETDSDEEDMSFI